MNPIEILLSVIAEHTPRSKWTGAPLESFRFVENTNRGDIGEEFICRYLASFGLEAIRKESRNRLFDLDISGRRLELKTASEDVGGSFQFNHVRLDRNYEFLLCLGIRPNQIMFNGWRKGELSEGVAGSLVRMAEGQGVTFKLTTRPTQMLPIEDLPKWVKMNVVG